MDYDRSDKVTPQKTAACSTPTLTRFLLFAFVLGDTRTSDLNLYGLAFRWKQQLLSLGEAQAGTGLDGGDEKEANRYSWQLAVPAWIREPCYMRPGMKGDRRFVFWGVLFLIRGPTRSATNQCHANKRVEKCEWRVQLVIYTLINVVPPARCLFA